MCEKKKQENIDATDGNGKKIESSVIPVPYPQTCCWTTWSPATQRRREGFAPRRDCRSRLPPTSAAVVRHFARRARHRRTIPRPRPRTPLRRRQLPLHAAATFLFTGPFPCTHLPTVTVGWMTTTKKGKEKRKCGALDSSSGGGVAMVGFVEVLHTLFGPSIPLFRRMKRFFSYNVIRMHLFSIAVNVTPGKGKGSAGVWKSVQTDWEILKCCFKCAVKRKKKNRVRDRLFRKPPTRFPLETAPPNPTKSSH